VTPEQTAAALKKPIGDLGMQFMADPMTREAGKAAGLRGRPLYHLGRGGALGDVPAEVVVAAFAFFPPEVVIEHWNAGRQVMSPQEGARLYAEQCNEWGRRNFTGVAGIGRALELVEGGQLVVEHDVGVGGRRGRSRRGHRWFNTAGGSRHPDKRDTQPGVCRPRIS
jgi:hypothetical protein